MARRFDNTQKWKNERWFRLLDPYYKLSWLYINAMCDIAGVWRISCPDLNDDLRLNSPLNLNAFLKTCNTDYTEETGEEIEIQRIIRINEKSLWITSFMFDQYQTKAKLIDPADNFAKAAIRELGYQNLLACGIRMGYLPLTKPFEALATTILSPSKPFQGLAENGQGAKEREREKEINTQLLEAFFPNTKKTEPAAAKDGKGSKPPMDAIRGGKQHDLPVEELPPPMTAMEFLQYEEQLLQDHLFLDPLLMSKGKLVGEKYEPMPLAELKRWLIQFHVHIAGREDLRKSPKGYKNHFKNWFNKEWPKGLPVLEQKVRVSNTPKQISEADLKKYT